MASITSRLFTIFLRLIRKKYFLNKWLDTGRLHFYSSPYPPAGLLNTCHIDSSEVNGHNVFVLKPYTAVSRKHILYFHGGAYVQSFVRPHWLFLADLVKATNCTITAPDYPLAPAHTYEDAFAMADVIYKQLITDIHPEDIILMGDSSGGGLALAFAQQLHARHIPPPERIILLSPWLDITLSNPEIKEIDPADPFLGIEGLLKAGRLYAGKTRPDHPLLSPIYGSLQGLRNITVFAGASEVLVADTRKLKRLADAEGVPLEYHEYPHMFHAWMLLNFPESRQARKLIAALINGG